MSLPVPEVSIIDIEISLFAIRSICSLKGVTSFEEGTTVTETLAVPSVIAVGANDVNATCPVV